MIEVPWDWIGFMFATQCLPVLGVLATVNSGIGNSSQEPQSIVRYLLVFQILSLATMWLVFGGYTTDSPRYLTRFDRNPLSFEEEQLFWIIGSGLSTVFLDPWPMKILSWACSLLISFSILIHFKSESDLTKMMVIWFFVFLPGFYFLEGNVIRQGYSLGLLLFGAYFLVSKNYFWAFLLCIFAFFFHRYSIIVAFVIVFARFVPGVGIFLIVACVVTGIVGDELLDLFGFSVAEIIPYSGKSIGHYPKLIVYSLFTLGLLYLRHKSAHLKDNEKYFIDCYVYLFSISLLFAEHEKTFERISLNFEILLALCVVFIFRSSKFLSKMGIGIIIIVNILAIKFWTYPSILKTMGFI